MHDAYATRVIAENIKADIASAQPIIAKIIRNSIIPAVPFLQQGSFYQAPPSAEPTA